MEWWDPRADKYRTSFPDKLVFGFGWPAIRWFMFRLPSETAHHLAISGLRWFGIVDDVWAWVALPFKLIGIVVAAAAIWVWLLWLEKTGRIMT